MSKQDRHGVRTPAGLERKYAFGQIDTVNKRSAKQGTQLNQVDETLARYMATNDVSLANEVKRAKAAEQANDKAIKAETTRAKAAEANLDAKKQNKVSQLFIGSSSGVNYAGFGLVTSSANKTVRITIPVPMALEKSTYSFSISGAAYVDGADGSNSSNAITTTSGTAYSNGMGVFFNVTVTDTPSGGAQFLRLAAGAFVKIT